MIATPITNCYFYKANINSRSSKNDTNLPQEMKTPLRERNKRNKKELLLPC